MFAESLPEAKGRAWGICKVSGGGRLVGNRTPNKGHKGSTYPIFASLLSHGSIKPNGKSWIIAGARMNAEGGGRFCDWLFVDIDSNATSASIAASVFSVVSWCSVIPRSPE